MLPQHVLLALVATVAAVPLNINLGAYSPALVVGDGEIAIGEAKSASELMATLASGSNEAAAENAAAEGGAQQGQQEEEQAQEAPAAENQEQPTEGEAAKRAPNLLRRAISDFITRRTPAPVQEDKMVAVEGAMEWIKRDLEGFNAALTYAREALKDQPKVELGSPNAGIGILVNPGVNVPKDSAAAGSPAAERKVKRDEVADETESPKMTLVAITEV